MKPIHEGGGVAPVGLYMVFKVVFKKTFVQPGDICQILKGDRIEGLVSLIGFQIVEEAFVFYRAIEPNQVGMVRDVCVNFHKNVIVVTTVTIIVIHDKGVPCCFQYD